MQTIQTHLSTELRACLYELRWVCRESNSLYPVSAVSKGGGTRAYASITPAVAPAINEWTLEGFWDITT